jgi:hypothetical protein
MRLRKRLVERAIEHASNNSWEEAINDNLRILELGRDAETLNRIGKAYLELGNYDEALSYYRQTLSVYPTNVVARKNVARLDQLQSLEGGGVRAKIREHADPEMFIVATGKTALTTLTKVAGPDVVMRLTTGEKLDIEQGSDGKTVLLKDGEDRVIGTLEPHLALRLIEMIRGGNRYSAVVANLDAGGVKVLIREVYQAPGQRSRVSFPGKLGGDIAHFRTYVRDVPTAYELDAELSEEDDVTEDDVADETEDDFFRGGGHEEEEVGLEEIEADLSTDDDEEEES